MSMEDHLRTTAKNTLCSWKAKENVRGITSINSLSLREEGMIYLKPGKSSSTRKNGMNHPFRGLWSIGMNSKTKLVPLRSWHYSEQLGFNLPSSATENTSAYGLIGMNRLDSSTLSLQRASTICDVVKNRMQNQNRLPKSNVAGTFCTQLTFLLAHLPSLPERRRPGLGARMTGFHHFLGVSQNHGFAAAFGEWHRVTFYSQVSLAFQSKIAFPWQE